MVIGTAGNGCGPSRLPERQGGVGDRDRSSTGVVYVAQYLSLHQDSLTNTPNEPVSLALNGAGQVTVTLTDGDGDQASANVRQHRGSQISFFDDGPTAPTVTVSAATVGVDETPAVQTTGGATDVLGSSAINFNGSATTVAGLFTNVANKGTDPDVPGPSLDNGALSFAASSRSLVSLGTLNFGADGPAASGAEKFALTVNNAASGLTLTDGAAITLSLDGSGRIIGTVAAGDPNGGKTAFAIAIDPVTGEVYVAQYLSLHNPNAANPNDSVMLAAGSVGVTVTLTDGDGDQVSSVATDVSSRIRFLDDGPTAPTVTVSAAIVGVDETPGVQVVAGVSSDVLGTSAISFNGAATTVAGLFGNVANKGTDPDVPVASLDNGALSFASSGAGSIVTVTGGAFGADGPAASAATTYALSVTNAASGLTLTDGTAITLSLVDGRVIGTVAAGDPNGLTGKVAFAIALDPVTGEMYVAQYLSLHQDSLTNTPNDFVTLAAGSVGVTVRLTDGDGDQVSSVAADVSNHVQFADDGPTLPTVTVSAATVGVDETPGVQDAAAIVGPPPVPAETDIAGSTSITFGGAPTTVAGVFAGVVNAGVDPDVPGASLDNGALSFASSTGDVLNLPPLATLIANGAFGADGPAAVNPVSYALTVSNPTPAGLTLTDGTAITLSLVNGMVIGTAGTDAVRPGLTGKVAFAIAIDPVTGEAYVAQYLSLHQDSATTTPNDFISLAASTVGVTVTLTDGDGDQVATTATDISSHVSFFDDGPTLPTVTVSAATIGVDETPAVQDALSGGARTMLLGSTAITFNGTARPRLRGCLTGVANKGTDPDVPAASLDNGALSFASSGAWQHRDGDGRRLWRGRSGHDDLALTVSNAASG